MYYVSVGAIRCGPNQQGVHAQRHGTVSVDADLPYHEGCVIPEDWKV